MSEALRTRQARTLQATLDNIRDGILVFGETDRVAAFNNIFFQLMDFPERLAAIGATLDVFREFDVAQTRKSFDQVHFKSLDERMNRKLALHWKKAIWLCGARLMPSVREALSRPGGSCKA